MIDLDNIIEKLIKKLPENEILNDEYKELYNDFFDNERLVYLFSSLHTLFTINLERLNQRLPVTSSNYNHFRADYSRFLLNAIEISDQLIKVLQNSEYACDYDEYYKNLTTQCKSFLSATGGSSIPQNFGKVELYYTAPIFRPSNAITTPDSMTKSYPLKQKGAGSYANVFTYYDEYYKTKFAIKRAFKDLNEKELERFRLEFKTMKDLNSPYILTVYSYDDKKNQYIMEYMDKTLQEYIDENNSTLSLERRKGLIFQILKAFEYIHSKSMLHRDISPKNILVKLYDDIPVLKVCDFGLVKIPDSTLTSQNTDFKGYFNDPALVLDGFANYSIEHEIYALTRLIVYVLTGKTNLDKIENCKVANFINKGINPDKSLRFKNIAELKSGVLEMLS